MSQFVISGTGLFIPPHSISNEELVIAFNQYVENFNNQHAAEIEAGEIEALVGSSPEFIEKLSRIHIFSLRRSGEWINHWTQ